MPMPAMRTPAYVSMATYSGQPPGLPHPPRVTYQMSIAAMPSAKPEKPTAILREGTKTGVTTNSATAVTQLTTYTPTYRLDANPAAKPRSQAEMGERCRSCSLADTVLPEVQCQVVAGAIPLTESGRGLMERQAICVTFALSHRRGRL